MKFVIVLVCCVLGVLKVDAGSLNLPQEVIDLMKNLSETCRGETAVDDSVVAKLRKAELVDDPKGKCYLKCMMMQLQAMKDDGSLDVELIDATMPEVIKSHGGMETIHKCKGIKDADLCETAYQLLVCFKKENPGLADMFE